MRRGVVGQQGSEPGSEREQLRWVQLGAAAASRVGQGGNPSAQLPKPPKPRTCGVLPAMVITPTVFSGWCCVLAPASRLTASACAWKRVGA